MRTVTVRGRRHPVACLTFDACGNPEAGAASNGFDKELVDFLRERRVQATLFISRRWATARPRLAAALAEDPLFEIGNHGTLHRPVAVDGRAAYGIAGTASAAEAVGEVWENTLHLERLVGRRPTLFRSGTAHYDDVGVAIVRSLGQLPVGLRHERRLRRVGVGRDGHRPAARPGPGRDRAGARQPAARLDGRGRAGRRPADAARRLGLPEDLRRSLTAAARTEGRVNPKRRTGHEQV